MHKRISILIASAFFIGGCGIQLSPPQMIGEQSSDVAVKDFLYAGKALAAVYGYEFNVAYAGSPVSKPSLELLAARTSIPYQFDLKPTGPMSKRPERVL